MEKMVLAVPKMWADHHVLKVREALTVLDGVHDIYASSAWKTVIVNFDSNGVQEDDIVATLAGAGYDVSEELQLEHLPPSTGDPAWKKLGVRTTRTNQRDLELSGDFRRY